MKEKPKIIKVPHPPKEVRRWCYCKECEEYWRKSLKSLLA
jgi:hypothetical protein